MHAVREGLLLAALLTSAIAGAGQPVEAAAADGCHEGAPRNETIRMVPMDRSLGPFAWSNATVLSLLEEQSSPRYPSCYFFPHPPYCIPGENNGMAS